MISHSLVTTRISSPEGMKVGDRHVTWVSANYPGVEVKQDRADREVMAKREVKMEAGSGAKEYDRPYSSLQMQSSGTVAKRPPAPLDTGISLCDAVDTFGEYINNVHW